MKQSLHCTHVSSDWQFRQIHTMSFFRNAYWQMRRALSLLRLRNLTISGGSDSPTAGAPSTPSVPRVQNSENASSAARKSGISRVIAVNRRSSGGTRS